MVNSGFEALDTRFVEVINILDMRERVEKTERQIEEIRRALTLASPLIGEKRKQRPAPLLFWRGEAR